jgi:hypothetical protein
MKRSGDNINSKQRSIEANKLKSKAQCGAPIRGTLQGRVEKSGGGGGRRRGLDADQNLLGSSKLLPWRIELGRQSAAHIQDLGSKLRLVLEEVDWR